MSERPTSSETWETIEDLYRAGQLSVREIARQYRISDTAIRKRAREATPPWTRDLTQKVQTAVRAELVRDAVRDRNAREPEIVNAAAALGVEVVRGHRKDLSQGRLRTERLGLQLDRLSERIEKMKSDDSNFLGALNAAASINEALGRAASKLIPLERKAFNLDESAKPADGGEGAPSGLDDTKRVAALAALFERGRTPPGGQVPGADT